MDERIQSSKNESPNVLVTGGAGFIGVNLCSALLRKGFAVYAVDNFVTGRLENITPLLSHERFHFEELDINDGAFFEKYHAIPFNAIYHLACPTGVPNIQPLAEEMLRTCSVGTTNALEIARRQNARFLFTSTAEIYGQPEVFPQHERYYGNVDPIGLRSPYEEGKRFSESLVAMYVRKYGVRATIVRIFNTYGPGMSLEDKRVIPQFIRSIVRGEELCVYGDGSQTRTHLYVDDLIHGVLLVFERGSVGEVYNVGGSTQVTIRELAELITKLAGRENNIVYRDHFIEDHRRREPSVEKVKLLGWEQTVPLEEGLERMPKIHLT